MNSSLTTKEIFAALVQAKAEFKPAVKASVNPHFRSNYADLATVISATEEALSKNGLCIIQSPQGDVSRQSVTIVTRLGHISGEWIEGQLELPAMNRDKFDPQSVGSAITYARRYALMGMLGITAEDDDGNAASATPSPAVNRASQVKPAPIAEALRDTKPDFNEYEAYLSEAEGAAYQLTPEILAYGKETEISYRMEPIASPKQVAKVMPAVKSLISDSQNKRFWAIAMRNGKTKQEIVNYLGSIGYEDSKEMPWGKTYDAACEWAGAK